MEARETTKRQPINDTPYQKQKESLEKDMLIAEASKDT